MRTETALYRQVRCSAFSLLEMLTATVMFVVIMGVAGSGFFLIVGELDDAGDGAIIEEQLGEAANLVRSDFLQLYSSEPSPWTPLGEGVSSPLRRYLHNKRPLLMEFNREEGIESSSPFGNAVASCDRVCFVTTSGIVAYYVGLAQASPQPRGESEKLSLYRHFRPFRSYSTDFGADGILRYCEGKMIGRVSAGAAIEEMGSFRQSLFMNRSQPRLLAFARSRDGADLVPLTSLWPEFASPSSLVLPPPDLAPYPPDQQDLADPSSISHSWVMPDRVLVENVFTFRATPYRYRREEEGGLVRDAQGMPIRLDAKGLNREIGLQTQTEWPCFIQPDLVEVTIAALPKHLAEDLDSGDEWIRLSETGAFPIPQKQAEVSASVLRQSFIITLPDTP